MLLQDSDPIPPVLPVKVRLQAIPRVGGPREAGEVAGASLFRSREAHIVYLELVYCLADRQRNPVYCGFIPMHVAVVFRHGRPGELNSALLG